MNETGFWKRVDKTEGCWIWRGATFNGYGRLKTDDGTNWYAHRLAYVWLVGPIPDGMVLDHECHNVAVDEGTCHSAMCIHRLCVNPAHLVPRLRGENVLRSRLHNAYKTHCPQGHPYDEANTIIRKGGWRECRACRNSERRRATANRARNARRHRKAAAA